MSSLMICCVIRQPDDLLCHEQPDDLLCHEQPDDLLCHEQPDDLLCHEQPDDLLCHEQPDDLLCHEQPDDLLCFLLQMLVLPRLARVSQVTAPAETVDHGASPPSNSGDNTP
ncbi:putative stress protein DDR48-like [Homarus americanus]|uniref:Putative stress protein DDR48-like n=1 Tax=Homarus americanus TaxID=6706 RepID=A0A8J5JS99_HOMAM|nr:putative stress protein DDR48-like [Homarus americanus]